MTSTAARPGPVEASQPDRSAAPWAVPVAVVVLVLVALGFVALAGPRVTAPFGDSDEGINGAVWGEGSRSLREQGVVDSRFGGRRLDGTTYANHPPLLLAGAALAETVAGERPAAARAPAWLGALATIPLLYLLLRGLRLDPVVAAAATAAGLGCHMFVVYGLMLDTMVVALPLAVGLLVVWQRTWGAPPGDAARAGRLLGAFALAALTGLAGWQGCFLAGLAGVALAARGLGRGRDRRWLLAALPYLGGAALAGGLTVGWARWAYGSLDPLLTKLGLRSGGTGSVSLPDMVAFQLPWLGQLLGLGLLAWVACALSLRDRRFRPVAALSLASVVVYAAAFREGSGGHQYWNYWGLVPATLGFAYALDAVARAARVQWRLAAPAVAALVLAVAGAVVAFALTRTDQAGPLIDRGHRTVEAVAAADLPDDQATWWYLGQPLRPDDWLLYNRLPPGAVLTSTADVRALAEQHPDHLVFVLPECEPAGAPDQPCAVLSDDEVTIATAGDLATQLG